MQGLFPLRLPESYMADKSIRHRVSVHQKRLTQGRFTLRCRRITLPMAASRFFNLLSVSTIPRTEVGLLRAAAFTLERLLLDL